MRAISPVCEHCRLQFFGTTEEWFQQHLKDEHPLYTTGYSKEEIDLALEEIELCLAP